MDDRSEKNTGKTKEKKAEDGWESVWERGLQELGK